MYPLHISYNMFANDYFIDYLINQPLQSGAQLINLLTHINLTIGNCTRINLIPLYRLAGYVKWLAVMKQIGGEIEGDMVEKTGCPDFQEF